MTRTPRTGPFVLEDDGPPPSPASAPPPPDAAPSAAPAVARAAGLAGRERSTAGRLFWWGLSGLVSLFAGLWAWDAAVALFARAATLGWIGTALFAALGLGIAGIVAREVAGLRRLARVTALRDRAAAARAARDRPAARAAAEEVAALAALRPQGETPAARLRERMADLIDAADVLDATERTCLAPLDAEARAIAAQSARGVAAATAFVPIPLLDVAAALLLNLRMIRRIGEVYGGRAGTLGAWRLLRAVAGHLAATGAVAAVDDLLGPVAGGGALARLSRRFGEGLVNGALTARVGVAAIEVCRPLPFHALDAPRARAVVAEALGAMSREA